MKKDGTSWGSVARWYDELLEQEGTYQSEVVLPNLLRLVAPQKGDVILDLACGQGFFSRKFSEAGAVVTGADISPELISLAKKSSPREIVFTTTPADNLSFLKDASVDKVTIVLAIQNIENAKGVFEECSRVLKSNGKLFIVMNHPTYRVPKQSSWGYDEEQKVQYRRVDKYLSEFRTDIEMHPGKKGSAKTISFHRSLQTYFKMLEKSHFAVSRLEEWISHKTSEKGHRELAENVSRKEIPLFLFLQAIKVRE